MIQYYEAAWHCQVTFSGIFFGSGSCFLHLDSAACLFSFLRSGCWALFLPPLRPAFRRNSVTALLVVWLVFDFIRFSCCWIALARHLSPFPGAWIALARHLPPSPAPGSVIRRVLRGLGAPGCASGSGGHTGLGGESPLAKRGGCHGLVTASVAAAKRGHDCANLRFGGCLFDAHKTVTI